VCCGPVEVGVGTPGALRSTGCNNYSGECEGSGVPTLNLLRGSLGATVGRERLMGRLSQRRDSVKAKLPQAQSVTPHLEPSACSAQPRSIPLI
jgi:hypothetical protein